MGMAETQTAFKAQVLRICRLYCSQVWNEILKQAVVEASSDLWKVENVYYPLAIRETAPSSSEVGGAPTLLNFYPLNISKNKGIDFVNL